MGGCHQRQALGWKEDVAVERKSGSLTGGNWRPVWLSTRARSREIKKMDEERAPLSSA
jgi:hypothetical protein